MPKTVVPALGLKSFSCPHCGALAQQHWLRVFAKAYAAGRSPVVALYRQFEGYDDKKIEDQRERKEFVEFVQRLQQHDVTQVVRLHGEACQWQLHNVEASMCDSCNGWTFWVKGQIVHPLATTELVPHHDLPHELRADFEEAAKIIDISPRGSAALLRLCIQKLMPIAKAAGKDLDEQIGSLIKRGLEPDVQHALDMVRVTGGNAVQPGEIAMSDNRETALALFELLDLIIERMISTPRKLEGIFGVLPEGVRRATEKRDAPKHAPEASE